MKIIETGNYARKTLIELDGDTEFVGRNIAQAEPHTPVNITGASTVIFSGQETNLTNCDFTGPDEIKYEDCDPPVHVKTTILTEHVTVVGEDGEVAFDDDVIIGETSEVVP